MSKHKTHRHPLDCSPVSLQRRVLEWFSKIARPLPWRKSKNPYRVWLSEIMLQQTSVDAVIPYYRRFVRLFPTVRSLAQAPLEKVLAAWSGLGYYRRARHVHQAAQIIVRQFNGIFPREEKAIRSLPGVGEYTARAILSIAFGQPYPVLDGNVARVMARVMALRGNRHQASFRGAIEGQLEKWISPRHPGEFNQALMEIGQTICRPRQPRCCECPLRRYCAAWRLGQPETFPGPLPRRSPELRYLAIAALFRGKRVLMVKGLDEGLLPDLWNFPSAFGQTASQALARLRRKVAAIDAGSFEDCVRIGEFRHRITYRSIRAHVYVISEPSIQQQKGIERSPARKGPRGQAGVHRWFTADELRHRALSQLSRKVAGALGPSHVHNSY